MRPLKLKMNAFGPYRDKVELDFTKFGSSSIFLVSGATGSGKTTIFDALTYALYNQASGDIREVDMFKSQFATDEDLCFVELTFEVNGVTYQIERIPKQKGPGKNGRVRNYPSTEVALYREEELISTRIAETNEKIESLLGLTVNQFQQIVLLPQGEFRKLLLSSSRDKEEIFRNIFQTHGIENFQYGLENKRRELKNKFKDYETRLEQLLSMINLDSFSEDELEKYQEANKKSDYQAVLNLLEEVIQKNTQQLKILRTELDKIKKEIREKETFIELFEQKKALEKQKKILNEEKAQIRLLKEQVEKNQKAKEVEKEYRAYKDFQTEIKELSKKINENKKLQKETTIEYEKLVIEDEKSKQDVEKIESMQANLFKLEEALKKLTLFEKQEKEMKQQEKESQKIATQLKELTNTIDELTKDQTKFLEKFEKISLWRDELSLIQKRIEKTRTDENSLQQEMKIIKNIVTLQTDFAAMITKNKQTFENSQKAEEKYEDAKMKYFSNLAGVLVEELVDGEPCPVCGSLDHPKPTVTDEESITEETLTIYEEERNHAKNEYTKISTQVEHLENELSKSKAELQNVYHVSVENEKYKELLKNKENQFEEVTSKLKELKTKEAELVNSLKKEDKWRKQLAETEEDKQKAEVLKATTKEKQSSLEKSKTQLIEDNKKLKNELLYTSAQDIRTEKEKLTTTIQKIQKNEKRIREALSERKNQQVKLETSLENLQEQLVKSEKKADLQKENYAKLRKKYGLPEDFTAFILEKEAEESYKEKIETYETNYKYTVRQLEETTVKFNEYKELKTKDLADLQVELKMTKVKNEEKEQEIESYIRKTSGNEDSYKEILRNYEESKKISEPLTIYSHLAEIANGTRRTNYISFERYVLSIYFSEILAMANKRFRKMTNNRYELVRNEQRLKGRGAEGLDINVFDRHAGKERSVKSLSGGETFKASLALALGLSDVVQNQQGGVRVDTLFIDEGFGTLDNDSLETAIETLIELQSSGRLIGIISHVEELKNRIPDRILVENNQEGSHARIETS